MLTNNGTVALNIELSTEMLGVFIRQQSGKECDRAK